MLLSWIWLGVHWQQAHAWFGPEPRHVSLLPARSENPEPNIWHQYQSRHPNRQEEARRKQGWKGDHTVWEEVDRSGQDSSDDKEQLVPLEQLQRSAYHSEQGVYVWSRWLLYNQWIRESHCGPRAPGLQHRLGLQCQTPSQQVLMERLSPLPEWRKQQPTLIHGLLVPGPLEYNVTVYSFRPSRVRSSFEQTSSRSSSISEASWDIDNN